MTDTIKTIKYSKKDPKQLLLNNQKWIAYDICSIPNNFGFIYDADTDKEGISEWFNHKGLTWVRG
jgi:hypothetical protein